LWFGLPGGASPEAVAEAEAMGRELSQWFEWYGPVIAASLRNASEKSATQTRVVEMLSVLHDARAPLAVVRYLLSNEGLGSGDQRLVEKELEYLERLLGECAPLASVAHEESCDVREVVRRVYVRYQREESGHAVVRFEDGYDPIHAKISDLDLERIVTNILGNAVRYANQVVLSIHADESLVEINVRDNGCGFTQATLDAVSRGEGSAVPSDSSGWGVGLASCRAKLEKRGGALLISSQEGVGSLVRIQLEPAAGDAHVARIPQVAEGEQREKRYHDASFACIVDDDSDQGESLARVLAQYGLRARVFSSLEPMLKELEVSRPSFILCDAHMPGGGAERLLTLFRGRDGVPIVAVMSGDASDDQQYRLAALGARAFFTKPVVLDDLLAWIDSLGPRTFSSAA
jgi:two-component system sensor histidine kinase EvgS